MGWDLDVDDDDFVRINFDGIPMNLVSAAKALVWLAMLPSPGGTRRKPNTVAWCANDLPWVLGFVEDLTRKVEGAAQLDMALLGPPHFEAFMQTMRNMIGRPEAPSRHVAQRAIHCWALLGEFRDEMQHLGLPALKFDPLAGATVQSLAEPFEKGSSDQISSLPDGAAALVLTTAEDFLERGDEIVEFQARVLAALRRDGGDAAGDTVAAVRDFPWRPQPDGSPCSWSVCASWDVKNAMAIARKVVWAGVGACVTVFFGEMGPRRSELCTIRGGRDPATGLPACIERVEFAGLTIFLVNGRVVKKRGEGGEPAAWTAGVEIIGSNELPPVVRALDLLQRICEPWCDPEEGEPHLFQAFDLRRRQVDRERRPKTSRKQTVSFRLEQFLRDYVDWSRLANDPETRSLADRGWEKTSARALRKTLVTYGLRLDGSLLGALREELHHRRDEETDGSYCVNDPKLFERARELASLEVARAMLERSGAARGPRGPLETVLDAHVEDVRGILSKVSADRTLDHVASLAVSRLLATPRVPAELSVPDDVGLRGPTLAQRYRDCRRAVLEAERRGLLGEFEQIRLRADQARAALSAMGIDPPSDRELMEDGRWKTWTVDCRDAAEGVDRERTRGRR